ncbi:MAG: serine hydrolase [Bacteroidetes bacterium]|nr:serine hydrolase [Bacteroidota bacterium]
MKRNAGIICLTVLIGFCYGIATTYAQPAMKDDLLESLMKKKSPVFDSVLARRNDWNVQVIYTEIERSKKGKLRLTDHFFNVDDQRYYYPASTVKLPVAILALQKLNELNMQGLDKYTTMITGSEGGRQTEVCNDPSAPDGRPTIAHYIKKILLVSDNDAFNRLYEFLGQEYINQTLQQMGYSDIQIIHRLSVSLTEEENRHTNPVEFMDSTGKVIFYKPAAKSRMVYADRNTKMGIGYYRGDELVHEPFDFSKKNRFTLTDLHRMIRAVMYPETLPEGQRFRLTEDDYAFLRKYMSMLPRESAAPVYDPAEYPDAYVKFLYYGSEQTPADTSIRIFNKVGDAYGFLIDGAYFVNYKDGREFFLSAVIHCNADGIFNDDKYEYNTIGFPFLKELGKLLMDYERTKVRKRRGSFSPQKFHYTN